MQKKHLVVIGGPGVGKGLIGKRLKEKYGHSLHALSTGGMIQHRLANDPFFHVKYAHVVATGGLLPDDEAICIASQAYIINTPVSATHIYWDGVFRTQNQANWATSKRILNKWNTLCIILHADVDTCLKRYKHRVKEKTDGFRIDDHSFPHRFGVYQEHLPHIHRHLQAFGIDIRHIDANRDLETDVVPQVTSIAKTFWTDEKILTESAPTESPLNLVAGLSARQRVQRSWKVQSVLSQAQP